MESTVELFLLTLSLNSSQKGLASDPIKYFAAPENQDLGIVKRQRKPNMKLIVAPFPEKQRGTSEFFFQAPSKILLTTGSQP